MDLCQKSCVVIGHFEGEARPAEVFIAVFCLDAGEGEVCFCRVLQTYRDEKLNAVIIILRDRSAVICFQHPLRLPQCPVKKLDFHDAVADRFQKTLAILCFLKNVLILWNNIQSDIKDKLCWVLHIFCTFRKVYNSSFEKIVFRIKSLQEPSLPVRDKIWDKINIDRLIIAIK